MRLLGIMGLVLLGSCLETSTLTCGDVTCSGGAVCSPGGNTCTTQSQIDACMDADKPATTCTAPDDRPGVCRDGYCQEVRCGDMRVDPGESCDDGNTKSFDGCSDDCVSDETCGNSVTDRGTEECDDGNTEAHDSCSPTCRNESPIWRELVDTTFAGRSGHAMVYDSVRKRVVLFGGRTASGLSSETWEFDGDQWTLRPTSVSPSARADVALAYDPIRQRTVLFGGLGSLTTFGDTWEWDGTAWNQQFPATSPTARSGSPIAFHPGRSAIVLYGGSSSTEDTWEYDGTTWTSQTGAGTIGKVQGQAMSYDPTAGGIVLFNAGLTGKTYVYDATGAWTELTITSAPLRSRIGYGQTFDASVGHTVLVGGSDGECGPGTGCSDAFELVQDTGLSSFSWVNVGSPYAPANGGLVYDEDTSELIVMGGVLAGITLPQDATWRRKATLWSRLAAPPARARCQLAYLPAVGGTILFGGEFAAPSDGTKTWLLENGQWTRLRTATSPPLGTGEMVLDRARNKLVSFDTQSATWEFDGTNWTNIPTATAPPARERFAMVYDDQRGAVVMFGGRTTTKVDLDDTWIYDGTNWTLLPTPTAPQARSLAAMSYDRARDVIVLFGGSKFATTWELSGTTWTEKTIAGPTARSGTPMAFDPKRGSSVLFSGAISSDTLADDTWEYVDGAWRQAATVGPVPRSGHCSTYDESLEKVVVFSGSVQSSQAADTWLFGYE
jgi:cysteine-rich repeat protein